MKFTGHAKIKLEIYGIPENEVVLELRKPITIFFDEKEEAYIKIIQWQNKPFAVVCDVMQERIITIYKTDEQTISNRQKSKRWT